MNNIYSPFNFISIKDNKNEDHHYLFIGDDNSEIHNSIINKIKRLKYNMNNLVIAGGVSANSMLREKLSENLPKGKKLYMPPLSLCGDNAAMIGAQGYFEFLAGNTAGMELNAYATKSILGETL